MKRFKLLIETSQEQDLLENKSNSNDKTNSSNDSKTNRNNDKHRIHYNSINNNAAAALILGVGGLFVDAAKGQELAH